MTREERSDRIKVLLETIEALDARLADAQRDQRELHRMRREAQMELQDLREARR